MFDVAQFSNVMVFSIGSFKLRIPISKYHSWYLCQISLQIMLLPILKHPFALNNLFSITDLNLELEHFEYFDMVRPTYCRTGLHLGSVYLRVGSSK